MTDGLLGDYWLIGLMYAFDLLLRCAYLFYGMCSIGMVIVRWMIRDAATKCIMNYKIICEFVYCIIVRAILLINFCTI